MQDKMPLPLILGWDFAGVIEKKGPRVTGLEIDVSVSTRPSIFRDCAYAEYIAVKASKIALKPDSINYDQAADMAAVD